MGIIARILGNSNVIDQAAKGIDKVFFTSEEKAENWINTLKAYEPFKLAQRLIALLVVGVYLFVWILSALILILSFWWADMLELSKQLASMNNETLSLPFTLITAFYFAGGAAEGIVNKFKKK